MSKYSKLTSAAVAAMVAVPAVAAPALESLGTAPSGFWLLGLAAAAMLGLSVGRGSAARTRLGTALPEHRELAYAG
jgi:hypothetical protein